MGRTALELIGQGGLGHSFDPLTEDKADDFADAVKAYLYVDLVSSSDIRNRQPDERPCS